MKNNLKALPGTVTVQITYNEMVGFYTYIPEKDNEIISFGLGCDNSGYLSLQISDPATNISFDSGIVIIGNMGGTLVPSTSTSDGLKAGETYFFQATNLSVDPNVVTFTIKMSVYNNY